MKFDRQDICEAWFIYLSLNHGGQGSISYARQSKLLSYFRPRQSLRSPQDLTDNGQSIYSQLGA